MIMIIDQTLAAILHVMIHKKDSNVIILIRQNATPYAEMIIKLATKFVIMMKAAKIVKKSLMAGFALKMKKTTVNALKEQ